MEKALYVIAGLILGFLALIFLLYIFEVLVIVAVILGISALILLVLMVAAVIIISIIAVPYYLLTKEPETQEYQSYDLDEFK